MRTFVAYQILFALTLAASACEDPAPPPRFRVTFISHSDGERLPGVRVIADGQVLGETAANGELGVEITGREGQALAVNAQCPEGHRAPEQLPLLTLRAFQGLGEARARGIEMTIACPPSERIAAVVVRALDQDDSPLADLPVRVRGQEIARTDASGVAHFSFSLRPSSTFRVQLDTEGIANLRPQNPGTTFTVPDADDFFIMNQSFEVQRRRRRRVRATMAPTGPVLPMRIN
jgi:hypothetical protein